MSWKASGWAKEVTAGANGEVVTRSEKILLLVLADYHNDETAISYPSVRRLASEALMSVRRCQELLRSLERKGLLTTEVRAVEGAPHQTNIYRLALEVGCNSRTLGCDASHPEGAGGRTQRVRGVAPKQEVEQEVEQEIEPTHSSSESAPVLLFPEDALPSQKSAPVAHLKPKTRRGSKDLAPPDAEFVARMRAKYAELENFDLSYDAWENHESRRKHVSQERSLENWLRRDLQSQIARQVRFSRPGGGAPVAHFPAQPRRDFNLPPGELRPGPGFEPRRARVAP